MLPNIDLPAMDRVAREQANRQMAEYLCDVMAAVLPRVPTVPECVPRLVEVAGDAACAAGYEGGRGYSAYILISFLLGPGWERDPSTHAVTQVMADPGMDIDTRLDLALNRAILLRTDLEALMPRMLARIESALAAHDAVPMEREWQAFQELASMRGVAQDERVLDLLERYESDAFGLQRLSPPKRKRLTASDRRTYEHINWPLPQPTDVYRNVPPQICRQVGRHLLLALVYGRDYHVNPLLWPLQQVMDRSQATAWQASPLQAYLQRHRQVLTELSHGR